MVYLGIDLSASAKRPSAVAFLNDQSELIELGSFREYTDLLPLIENYKPSVIAIDAPLGLPKGLDCLEEDCSCTPVYAHKGRVGEVELARMGIGCFFTNKRSIIKKMIYRGLQICHDLATRGNTVIEVYPYATKVVLFGDKIPPKSSPQGILYLREHLPTLVPGLGPHVGKLDHDRCDAVLAAYTARLHQKRQTDSLGIAEEGFIVIPKPRYSHGAPALSLP